MPKLFIEMFSGTIRGKKRDANEDTAFGFLAPPLQHSPPVEMLAVLGAAGGMGGSGAGDAASAAARSFIESVFKSGGETDFAAGHGIAADDHIRLLSKVFDECNRIILHAAVAAHRSGLMGTTLALGVIVYNANDNKTYLHVGNVGNCRGYIIRGEQIFHATEEDSVAWRLYKKGSITYSELLAHPLRSQITVMGIDASISPEVHSIELRAGDAVIFCTDGVHEALDDAEIYAVTRKYPEAKKACEHLLEAARVASSGKDNVAAAMVCCSPVPLAGAKRAPAQAAARVRRSPRRSKAMIAVWSTVAVLAVAAAVVYFQQPAAIWSVKDFLARQAVVAPRPAMHNEANKTTPLPAADEQKTRAQLSDASPLADKEAAVSHDNAGQAMEKNAVPRASSSAAASDRPAVKPAVPAAMKVEWNAETERFRITTSSASIVPTQIRYGSQVFDVVPVKSVPNLYRTTKPLSREMFSAGKVVHVTVADSKKTVAVVFTQNQ